MLFTDVATIYNHYTTFSTASTDVDVDMWKRTVLKGVQWSHNKVQTSVNGEILTQNKVESITFDFGKDYGNDAYIDSIGFKALTDKSGFWTLDNKDGLDVIVLGECDKEIGSNYAISDLANDNQYLGTVVEVSDNRNRTFLKNIKVIAK